jgi:uncharacterized protein YrrD
LEEPEVIAEESSRPSSLRHGGIMGSASTISVVDDIRGTPLLQPGTSERLGEIVDALVAPTRGEVIGLAVLTREGKERVLLRGDYFLGVNLVMASEKALCDPKRLDTVMQGRARAHKDLVGTKVVTEDGKLLGHVSDVRLSEGWTKIVYRVSVSGGHIPFRGSFLLAGDVPHSYSRSGTRLIVPAGTEESYAIWSFGESLAETTRRRSRIALVRDLISRHAFPVWLVLTLVLLGIMLWY